MSKRKYYSNWSVQYNSLKDILNCSCEKHKKRPAFYEKAARETKYCAITYDQFKKDVVGFGTALEEILNIKGEKIILIGENSYKWDTVYLAVVCGKNIIVPTDKDLSCSELINVVNTSEANTIIYSSRVNEKINSIRSSLQNIKYYINMNEKNIQQQNEYSFDDLLYKGKEIAASGDNNFMEYQINPDEFKILLFTSGTTSEPKGVMLSHRNVVENIREIKKVLRVKPQYKYFSILPSHHCYETITARMVQLCSGASVAYCEGKDKIVENLKEAKPDIMLTVPLLSNYMYKQIIEKLREKNKEQIVYKLIKITDKLGWIGFILKKILFKEIHDAFGGNIKAVISGAAPCNTETAEFFKGIGIAFVIGYGLTENSPTVALNPEKNFSTKSVGIPLENFEVKINNPNEFGEGEILVKGPSVMLGYFKDPKLTKETIKDCWLYTGDVGYMDMDGWLYITGRIKNVIIGENGRNIYPEELEVLIKENIEFIEDVLVYSKIVHDGNSILTAKIKLNDDKVRKNFPNGENIDVVYDAVSFKIEKLNSMIAKYKNIQNIEFTENDFERTTSMKIKRYKSVV